MQVCTDESNGFTYNWDIRYLRPQERKIWFRVQTVCSIEHCMFDVGPNSDLFAVYPS